MKKLSLVAVAVAVCVGSAFASWDYFPPKEAGKGEAKLGFGYGIGGAVNIGPLNVASPKISSMDLSVGARYSIIEGLEASLTLPVPLSLSNDGDELKEYTGLVSPEIGVRYWLPMGLGFFLDFKLPVDTRYNKDADMSSDGGWHRFVEPNFAFGVGAQFSTKFTDELSLGSEVGITYALENSDMELAPGMGLGVGVELDYSLGMVTPLLGVDFSMGLTPGTYKGDAIKNSKGDDDIAEAVVNITVGASASFTDNLGADLTLKLGVVGSKDSTDPDEKAFIPLTIGAHFSYNF